MLIDYIIIKFEMWTKLLLNKLDKKKLNHWSFKKKKKRPVIIIQYLRTK